MGHGKGIPPDVLALSIPVTFAACAFSFVVFRAFAYDPEWTNGITPETEAASKKGDVYKNQIKGFFIGANSPRPTARSMSLFNNEVVIDK